MFAKIVERAVSCIGICDGEARSPTGKGGDTRVTDIFPGAKTYHSGLRSWNKRNDWVI